MKKRGLTLRNPRIVAGLFTLELAGSLMRAPAIGVCFRNLHFTSGNPIMINSLQRYRLSCTLSFGDIYGQIITWLLVIFVSLAAAMALMGASRPIYALATIGLILVLSLPFLLFAFVTTLLNHIEVQEIEPAPAKVLTPNVPVASTRTAAI
jgi:hypothetical protein